VPRQCHVKRLCRGSLAGRQAFLGRGERRLDSGLDLVELFASGWLVSGRDSTQPFLSVAELTGLGPEVGYAYSFERNHIGSRIEIRFRSLSQRIEAGKEFSEGHE
jgi:hypothetical protein